MSQLVMLEWSHLTWDNWEIYKNVDNPDEYWRLVTKKPPRFTPTDYDGKTIGLYFNPKHLAKAVEETTPYSQKHKSYIIEVPDV